MTQTPELIVTQADRDAAANSSPHNERWGALVRTGNMDSDPLVQAFAAHRIAAEADNAALKAKNEALVEALGKRGFMMTETDRSKNYPRARRLIIGFENGDDADDLMAMLSRVTRQALAGAQ